MNKLSKICCFFILLVTTVSASAHDFYGDYFRYRSFIHYPGYYGGFGGRYVHDYYPPYHQNSLNYLAPAIIGGVIGYTLAKPRAVSNATLYTTPEVIYTTPQVIYNSIKPLVYSSPVGHRYESILDANCNCYRTVLVAY
jgi:hypothetical protein